MQGLLEQALANPWRALEFVLDSPLHPGGQESTEQLLDRAEVGDGTVLLDVGCGGRNAISLARDRGATAVGLDYEPPDDGIRGDLSHLPVSDACVNVVLAECVMCLVPDQTLAFREARRVLDAEGRVALSDMVVAGETPDLPAPVDEVLCLSNALAREELLDRIERAGFAVEDVRDHRENLLAMRDQVEESVDYEPLLRSLGDRGDRLLSSIDELDNRVDAGEISYVSLVASVD